MAMMRKIFIAAASASIAARSTAFQIPVQSLIRARNEARYPAAIQLCPFNQRSFSALRSVANEGYAREARGDGPQIDEIGVGIDLGTTNSAIAFLKDRQPTIIEIPNNGRTMPSVVAIPDPASMSPLVGKEAMEWEVQISSNGYRNVKRVIGTGATYLTPETSKVVPHLITSKNTDAMKSAKTKKKKKNITLDKHLKDAVENPVSLLLTADRNGSTHDKKTVSPTEISSMILRRLLDTAEKSIEKTITRAVIGVPAYFNDAQRDATIQAANMAGISKVKLLPEPEAAALAYGIEKESGDEELVLVFDLGGGTYDVSMLLIQDGFTEIICTSGNAQLGGSNFDVRIAQHFTKLVQGGRFNKTAFGCIVRAAEQVRIYLSNNRNVHLSLPLSEDGWTKLQSDSDVILHKDFDVEGTEGKNSTHLFVQMTRKEMEKICHEEFVALLRPIREVAIMAGALLPGDTQPSIVATALELEELYKADGYADFYDEDVVSGGSKQVQDAKMQEDLAQIELKEAKKAQQKGRKKARTNRKKERKYRDETRELVQSPSSVKVRGEGIAGRPISRIALVGGATRMPGVGRVIAALTGVTPQKTVDPDEAVALGCAVHVGVLDGEEGMGTILNPMQAAILRAVAEQQRKQGGLGNEEDDDFDDFDDSDLFEMEMGG